MYNLMFMLRTELFQVLIRNAEFWLSLWWPEK